MFHSTPLTITDEVKSFCRSITKKYDPIYVDVDNPFESEPLRCFINVDKQIAKHGGERIHGWIIWYREGVYIEAENHAVWLTPEGNLRDVAAPQDGERRVLFLRDDTAIPYPPTDKCPEMSCQNNRRRALCNDPSVKNFQKASTAYVHSMISARRFGSKLDRPAYRLMNESRYEIETKFGKHGPNFWKL